MLKTSLLVSPKAIARCFQVSRETVHQWTSGKLPHYVIGEASIRFHKADLAGMLGSRLMLSGVSSGAKLSTRKGQIIPMPGAFSVPRLPPFLTVKDVKVALSISRAAAYRLFSPPYIDHRRSQGVELNITLAIVAVQFKAGGKIIAPKEAFESYLDAVKVNPFDEVAALPVAVESF